MHAVHAPVYLALAHTSFVLCFITLITFALFNSLPPYARLPGLAAELFLDQKPTIMRLGGSMTNAPGFRFKNMVRTFVHAVWCGVVWAGVVRCGAMRCGAWGLASL